MKNNPTQSDVKDIDEILRDICMHSVQKSDGTLTLVYEGLSPEEAKQALNAHYYQKMLEIIGSDESARVPRKELWKSTGKVAEKFVEMPPARQRNKLRAELRAKLEQEFRRDV